MPERWRTDLRLRPDETAPGAARTFVRSVLETHGWHEAVENALLLTTELATNAVVHAGTAVVVEVSGDDETIVIRVQDHTPGRLSGLPRPVDELHEGGRGLYLVDTLSGSWGTEHTATGKTVWFRFTRTTRTAEPVRAAPDSAPAPERLAPIDMGWLTAGSSPALDRLTLGERVTEVLRRLTDTLGASGGLVVVDDEETGEPALLAHHGLADATLSTVRHLLAASGHRSRPSTATVAAGNPLLRIATASADPAGGVGAAPLTLDGTTLGWVEVAADAGRLVESDVAVLSLVAHRMAIDVTSTRLGEAERRRRGWLSFLAEASELLAGSLDARLTLPLVAQLVLPSLATWSAVFLLDEREQPSLAAVAHVDERRTAPLREALGPGAGDPLTTAVAGGLQGTGTTTVPGALAELVETRDFDPATSSTLLVPLCARNRMVGGLVLVRPDGPRHTAEEQSLAEDLGRRAGLAVDNARLYSERTGVARALQAWLLPPELPVADDVEFAARYLAAGEGNEVGGDFYDVFPLGPEGWGLAVGDVCGKGAEAAAVTGLVRDVIRLMVRDGHQVPHVLQRLNRAILEQGDRGRFCTVAAARLRRVDDDLVLEVSSAGHPLPVVVRASGMVEFVGRPGMLVGVSDDFEVHEERVSIDRGDAVVFYTDGVTERRTTSRMFGEALLLDTLAATAGRSAAGIAADLERAVDDYAADPLRDDLAILVVRRLP